MEYKMTNIIPMHSEKGHKSDAAMSNLQQLVAEDMTKVNEAILTKMDSPVALIPELAGHLIASGGKRLRPMLTLATSKLIGYEGKRHIDLAACVEFIHTATLLHDDVVDESTMRRGSKTANAIFGNQACVLVGDFLFSRAFELMIKDGSLRILKILSGASSIIAEGEVLQLMVSHDLNTTEDQYLEVIASKTAALFAASCEISGVMGEQGDRETEALASFGKYLGIAFQLVDDALDYSAKQATLGKTVGDDFREGKLTLPIILSYRRGDEEERAFWKRTIEKQSQTKEDLATATALMTKHNALDDTIMRARHYGDMARDALAIFPDNAARKALVSVIDFCIERAY